MKQILITLAIAGFTYTNVAAQTAPLIPCAAPKGKVCKRSGYGVSCYKTPYAEDFKICKGDYGYFVCCETPNATNSTHPALPVAEAFSANDYEGYMNEAIVLRSATPDEDQAAMQVSMRTPQSQSYPPYSNTACATPGGCISRRNYIRSSCYGGNNVAELNRAAYQGCPTPAYDGPEENKARNVNANDPLNSMPPLTGRPQ